jgi:hypothetical protein
LNPKDGSFGSIAFDSLTRLLKRKPWEELLPANLKLPAASKGSCSKAAIIVLAKLLISECCSRFAIRTIGRRHIRLGQMVGFAVNQCGHGLALKAAAQLYKQGRLSGKTSLTEHLAEFGQAWHDFTKKEVAKFNRAERRAYSACKSDMERSAFLIIRNWLKPRGGGYVHRDTLAARLEVSGPRAGAIRSQFCKRGIMRMTADYVPHQWARRYEWLLSDEAKRASYEH